jgi:hypothetical protein
VKTGAFRFLGDRPTDVVRATLNQIEAAEEVEIKPVEPQFCWS